MKWRDRSAVDWERACGKHEGQTLHCHSRMVSLDFGAGGESRRGNPIGDN